MILISLCKTVNMFAQYHLHLIVILKFITFSSSIENYRLLNFNVPIHYDIEIRPYLYDDVNIEKRLTFDGILNLRLNSWNGAVNQIQISSKNIDIDRNKTKLILTSTGADDVFVSSYSYNNNTDVLGLILNKAVVRNIDYILTLEFVGRISNDLNGLYQSYYYDRNNVKQYFYITNLKPLGSRNLLPSYDEPHLKATYSLKIHKTNNYKIISNTEAVFEDDAVIIFKKTPRMSSYHFGFMLSNFENNSNYDNTIRIWTQPDLIQYTEYGLSVTQMILSKCQMYFQFNYFDNTDSDNNVTQTMGFEKLNIIVVPDLLFDGVETWGMIILRESNVIYHKAYTSDYALQKITETIAKHVSHLWFGNLVTAQFWDQVYLNDGFAIYFGTHILHTLFPDFEIESQFVVERLHSVLAFDADYTSHPMYTLNEVNSQNEINANFDLIALNKGASILRMFKYIVGEELFITALRTYLKLNAFEPVSLELLMDVLEPFLPTTKNANKFLRNWINKAGYPVIKVLISPGLRKATVTQIKFLYIKPLGKVQQTWNIPVSCIYGNGYRLFQRVILTDEDKNVTLNFEDWQHIPIFNEGQFGYYRVDYDLDAWKLIKTRLHSSDYAIIPLINRAQIIDDLLNFARAGDYSYEYVFEIISYLKHETNYIPWLTAFQNFAYLTSKWLDNKLNKLLNFIHDLIQPSFDRIGFDEKSDETNIEKFHRNNILYWYCKTGNASCISKSVELFNNYKQNNVLVNVNIRPAIYCTAIRYGDESDFNFLWTSYNTIKIATEQNEILKALGCAANIPLINQYLDLIFKESSKIPKQSHELAYRSLFSYYEENYQTVLDYTLKNYQQIHTSHIGFRKPLRIMIDRVTKLAQLTKIEKFLAKNDSLLNVDDLELCQRDVERIKDYLGAQSNINDEDEHDGCNKITASFTVLLALVVFSILIDCRFY